LYLGFTLTIEIREVVSWFSGTIMCVRVWIAAQMCSEKESTTVNELTPHWYILLG